MKEQDYINVSNLNHIRAIKYHLRELVADNKVFTDDVLKEISQSVFLIEMEISNVMDVG